MKKLIWLLCFSVWMCCGAQAATFLYETKARGFHILDAEMQYKQDSDSYMAQAHAQTKGLLNLFMKAESYFYSAGNRDRKSLKPDLSTFKNIRRGREKFYAVDFTDNRGFVDFPAAFLTLVNTDKPGNKTLRVRDTKREYKITLTYRGMVDPDPAVRIAADSWAFYTMSVEVTQGKKKGWFFNRLKNKDNPPLRLYFAHLPDVPEWVLMQAEIDSVLLGTIRLRLAEIDSDTAD